MKTKRLFQFEGREFFYFKNRNSFWEANLNPEKKNQGINDGPFQFSIE